MEYTLNTKITEDQKIIQTLVRDQVETLARWVCDTRERTVRDALISLGWTPPAEVEKPNHNIDPANIMPDFGEGPHTDGLLRNK